MIRNGDGTSEVYDIVTDPWERANLADTDVGQAIVKRYARALPNIYRMAPGPRDTLVN
jgi:hypothetical protein